MFKRAYFLVLPNAHLLDLAGPLQIIATLAELGIARVTVHCISPDPNVRTYQDVRLTEVGPLPAKFVDGDVLFVVGSKLDKALTASRPWMRSVDWLRRVALPLGPVLQTCGVCTGSFLLAQAGLLNGRLCTTHHRFIRQMKRQFPRAYVVENRVLVHDREVWTSAGVASGVDLALHVIASAFGDDAALQVARENVVHFRRFGNDPELSAPLRHRAHGNQRVHAVQDEIGKTMTDVLSGEALAERFGIHLSALAREFTSETGLTMKRYQTELRMELAHRLIVESELKLENIAERCGFGSVQSFRLHWNRREKLSPSELRRLSQPTVPVAKASN